jgi:type III pantothenate kinase
VDSVENETFYGGAILPGLEIISKSMPVISPRLPFIQHPYDNKVESCGLPRYPGRCTEEAILSGLYWGPVGAIKQFYEMFCLRHRNAMLLLTGGDGRYLAQGLAQQIPSSFIRYSSVLTFEGIRYCS